MGEIDGTTWVDLFADSFLKRTLSATLTSLSKDTLFSVPNTTVLESTN